MNIPWLRSCILFLWARESVQGTGRKNWDCTAPEIQSHDQSCPTHDGQSQQSEWGHVAIRTVNSDWTALHWRGFGGRRCQHNENPKAMQTESQPQVHP